MTALAEALAAAQRSALNALGKAYVSGNEVEDADEKMRGLLDKIGCTDRVEQTQLLAAWAVLRTTGAQLPAENGAAPKDEPASDRQWALLRDLAAKKQVLPPDEPLTKAKASEAISELQSGTYDPEKWKLPF